MDPCKHTHENLLFYLLGELSPGDMARVGQHVTGCPDCRREMIELAADVTRISNAFKSVPETAPASLAQQVLEQLPQKAPRRDSWPWRLTGWTGRLAYAGAAALAVLALFATNSVLSPSGVGGTIPASAIAADFREIDSQPNPAQFVSADQSAVAKWASREAGYPVKAADLSSHGLQLLGAGVCRPAGKDVAFLLYEKDGRRVAMFQMHGTRVDYEHLKSIVCGDHRMHTGRFGNSAMAACGDARRTVVVIGDLLESDVVDIVHDPAVHGTLDRASTDRAGPPRA